jgi:uncharacterized protein YeaO (DUF488 family)
MSNPEVGVMSAITLSRIYDDEPHHRGQTFLVERLWPRGVRRDDLEMDGWLKDVAPSTGLRRWFDHDPTKWAEFQRRYRTELDTNPQAWAPLVEAARRGPITLLYSSRDREHNNAVVLRDYLREHTSGPPEG